jgi:hypothetical protein
MYTSYPLKPGYSLIRFYSRFSYIFSTLQRESRGPLNFGCSWLSEYFDIRPPRSKEGHGGETGAADCHLVALHLLPHWTPCSDSQKWSGGFQPQYRRPRLRLRVVEGAPGAHLESLVVQVN